MDFREQLGSNEGIIIMEIYERTFDLGGATVTVTVRPVSVPPVTLGRQSWHYTLTHVEGGAESVIFEGDDLDTTRVCSAPEALHTLVGFLALVPGDTDAEYFLGYTPAQAAWRDAWAADLASAAENGWRLVGGPNYGHDDETYATREEAAAAWRARRRDQAHYPCWGDGLVATDYATVDIAACEGDMACDVDPASFDWDAPNIPEGWELLGDSARGLEAQILEAAAWLRLMRPGLWERVESTDWDAADEDAVNTLEGTGAVWWNDGDLWAYVGPFWLHREDGTRIREATAEELIASDRAPDGLMRTDHGTCYVT